MAIWFVLPENHTRTCFLFHLKIASCVYLCVSFVRRKILGDFFFAVQHYSDRFSFVGKKSRKTLNTTQHKCANRSWFICFLTLRALAVFVVIFSPLWFALIVFLFFLCFLFDKNICSYNIFLCVCCSCCFHAFDDWWWIFSVDQRLVY